MEEDLTGSMELRLLALERRCGSIDRSLGDLRRDIVALSQGIWDGWADFQTPEGPPPPKTCLAGVVGKVLGCFSQPLGSQTVTFKDHASGTVLGSATTGSDGSFSATLTITNPSQNVDVLYPVITGYNAATVSLTPLTCAGSSLSTVTLTPASGTMCLAPNCAVPTQSTLTVVSAIYGTYTATLSSGVWRTPLIFVNTPANGNCTAQTRVPIEFVLNGTLMQPQYSANSSTFCPNTAATFFAAANATLTTYTCSPWSATWSCTGPMYGSATDTVRWHV